MLVYPFSLILFACCRQLLSGHRASLCAKIGECRDPALCLHLALLIIFQTMTQQIVHASGRFVPQLLQFLKPDLEKSGLYDLLFQYQGELACGGPLHDRIRSKIMYFNGFLLFFA